MYYIYLFREIVFLSYYLNLPVLIQCKTKKTIVKIIPLSKLAYRLFSRLRRSGTKFARKRPSKKIFKNNLQLARNLHNGRINIHKPVTITHINHSHSDTSDKKYGNHMRRHIPIFVFMTALSLAPLA